MAEPDRSRLGEEALTAFHEWKSDDSWLAELYRQVQITTDAHKARNEALDRRIAEVKKEWPELQRERAALARRIALWRGKLAGLKQSRARYPARLTQLHRAICTRKKQLYCRLQDSEARDRRRKQAGILKTDYYETD
jgi:chromosome segregation ATPase